MKKRILSALLALYMILPLLPATALAKMPSDELTVNEFEWEVLRLVNIERANAGLNSLSMIEPLQQSCSVRAEEIGPVFSHTRPDGSDCYTAIPKTFKWKAAGENIAKGQRNPAEVMDS